MFTVHVILDHALWWLSGIFTGILFARKYIAPEGSGKFWQH